jgi:hypothetical protein
VAEHAIDWRTATVRDAPEGYELRVQLTPRTVGSSWLEAFRVEVGRRAVEAREQAWGDVEFWGETVIVTEFEPEAKIEVRRYLDELVQRANAVAAAKEAEAAETAKLAEAKAETRADASKILTDWFRSAE